jgi:hypothetical protein
MTDGPPWSSAQTKPLVPSGETRGRFRSPVPPAEAPINGAMPPSLRIDTCPSTLSMDLLTRRGDYGLPHPL